MTTADPTPTTPRSARIHYVSTRLGQLHVRDLGGDLPVALLWHGMFIDGTSWSPLLPALLPHRRLLVVDAPGHGLSAPLRRRSSIAECALVARELVDGLGIDGPVDWVGNAWGGHVGLELAVHDAGLLRSLVAISSPTAAIEPELRAKIRMLMPLLRAIGPRGPVLSAIVDAQLTESGRRRPEVRELVRAAVRRPTRASLAAAVGSFILDRDDVTAGLTSIGTRALFVASDDRGEWSPADAAAAAALARDAESVVIADARVIVPLEQPDALAREIVRFWRARDPRS